MIKVKSFFIVSVFLLPLCVAAQTPAVVATAPTVWPIATGVSVKTSSPIVTRIPSLSPTVRPSNTPTIGLVNGGDLTALSNWAICQACQNNILTKKNKWFKDRMSTWAPQQYTFPDKDISQYSRDEVLQKLVAIQAVLDEVQANANGYDEERINKEKKDASRWITTDQLCSGSCSGNDQLCLPTGIKFNTRGGPWTLDTKKNNDGTLGYHLVLKEQDSGSIFSDWTDESTLRISADGCACRRASTGDC